jgi:peroxiredoxin
MGMMKKGFVVLLGIVLISFSAGTALALQVGETAPNFTLKDTHGREHSLSDYTQNYVVLEWTNYDCPFVKKHYSSGHMQGLQREHTEADVVWLSINSSASGKQGNYSPDEWNEKITERGVSSTAVLLDPDGVVGKAYEAKTTPHMFVIDPAGKLIYQGAIDSIPSADPADIARSENYVAKALQEAQGGGEVETPFTKSYGCSVKY